MKRCGWWMCLLTVWSNLVSAEIYKSIDAEGHVTYSSSPSKGAKRLDLEPVPTLPANTPPPAAAARPRNNASPADFPKVDNSTQKNRDNTRRKILDDELNSEEKLLAEAREGLQDAEGHPEVMKSRDGQTRPTAKYEEKLKNLRYEISTHEKNIASLKSEIGNLK